MNRDDSDEVIEQQLVALNLQYNDTWRCAAGYRNPVSDTGRVIGMQGRLLKLTQRGAGGYHQVNANLRGSSKRVGMIVARFVALAHLDPPPTALHNSVDHINGDRTDNRAINLRWATKTAQQHNRRKALVRPNGVAYDSKYKNVCRWKVGRRHRKMWRAAVDGINLGSFSDEVDAARAADVLVKKRHGEFAVLNFPDEMETSD